MPADQITQLKQEVKKIFFGEMLDGNDKFFKNKKCYFNC